MGPRVSPNGNAKTQHAGVCVLPREQLPRCNAVVFCPWDSTRALSSVSLPPSTTQERTTATGKNRAQLSKYAIHSRYRARGHAHPAKSIPCNKRLTQRSPSQPTHNHRTTGRNERRTTARTSKYFLRPQPHRPCESGRVRPAALTATNSTTPAGRSCLFVRFVPRKRGKKLLGTLLHHSYRIASQKAEQQRPPSALSEQPTASLPAA